MTGRGHDRAVKAERRQRQALILVEQDIGHEGRVGLQDQSGLEKHVPEPAGGAKRHRFGLRVVGQVGAVRDDGRAGQFTQARAFACVVDMRVRDDDQLDVGERQTMAAQGLADLGGGTGQAGIDQNAALFANKQVAIDHAER